MSIPSRRPAASRTKPTRALALLALAAAAAIAAGCSSCRKPARPRTGPAPSFEIAPGAPAGAWTFRPAPAGEIAVPHGCALLEAPTVHIGAGSLLFMAARGETDSLAVATGEQEPGSITASRGIVPLAPRGAGSPVRDVPWVLTLAPPVMAASAGRWLAVVAQADALSPSVRLWLWRERKPLELLAEGDRLQAFDARCAGDTCAVLTSRPGTVAVADATLWTGSFDDPVGSWASVGIGSPPLDPSATPTALAWLAGGERRAKVAVENGGQIVFFAVSTEGVSELSRGPRDDLVLGVDATEALEVAATARGKPDPQGCVAGEVGVAVSIGRGEPRTMTTPSWPAGGHVIALERGALVTWIAPVNCKDPGRKVVYAAWVPRDGAAVSPMALGDSDGHAAAASGSEAHVWLRRKGTVTWLRMRCGAQGAAP